MSGIKLTSKTNSQNQSICWCNGMGDPPIHPNGTNIPPASCLLPEHQRSIILQCGVGSGSPSSLYAARIFTYNSSQAVQRSKSGYLLPTLPQHDASLCRQPSVLLGRMPVMLPLFLAWCQTHWSNTPSTSCDTSSHTLSGSN